MSELSYVAETLVWCNEKRKEQGKRPLKKLPKGYLGDPSSCPCGAATGLRVFPKEYEDKKEKICSLPVFVREFVEVFDRGDLPQYVKKEKGV